MSKHSKKRNATIELLRFISIIAVTLTHFYIKIEAEAPYLGYKGNIGVEFFFLVSGFFLAKSALVERNAGNINLWKSTKSFMSKKIDSLYFPMVVMLLIGYSLQLCLVYIPKLQPIEIAKKTSSDIFEFFMLRQAGFSASYINGAFWFISALILVSALCFPLLLKHGDSYYIFAGLSAIFILGWMNKTYGSSLGDVDVWTDYFYKCQLRAFAEMNLGIFMFGLSEYFSKVKLTKFGRFCISIVEIAIYAAFVVYLFYPSKKRMDYVVLAYLFVAMLISLSQKTYLSMALDRISIIPLALGKLSMYIYFDHMIFAKYVFPGIAKKYGYTPNQLLLPFIITIIVAAVLLIMFDKFWKKHRPLKKLFIKKEDALTE